MWQDESIGFGYPIFPLLSEAIPFGSLSSTESGKNNELHKQVYQEFHAYQKHGLVGDRGCLNTTSLRKIQLTKPLGAEACTSKRH